jgi:carbamoyl-phosphate synthase small subunit
MTATAKLALEDGTVYTGASIGAAGEIDGEVCFNTSMTGYQEILTDPSYRGQIVTMTYPQIGNYGVNDADVESSKPHLAGFVVREHSRVESNFRSAGSLSEYLKHWNVVAIESIDTRALVRRLRSQGAMRGVLSTVDLDDASLVAKAKASPGLVGRDLVREVMPSAARAWNEKLSEWTLLDAEKATRSASPQSAIRNPQSPKLRIVCSPHPGSANAWPSTGSTPRAMRTPTAISATTPGRRGRGVSG